MPSPSSCHSADSQNGDYANPQAENASCRSLRALG
jgi:hypothetical protein